MNNNGFTLIELLIAMSLTSIIGMVLFSTYDMVMQFGNDSKEIVFQKEQERLLSSILDNDFTNIAILNNKPIPVFLSKQEPSDQFKQFIATKDKNSNTDTLVISLQTTFSIHTPEQNNQLPSAHIVEYYLQKNQHGSYNLIRQERPYASIDIDIPPSELLLDKNIKEVKIEALFKEQYYSDWEKQIKSNNDFYPQAFKVNIIYGDKKEFIMIIPIPVRERELG